MADRLLCLSIKQPWAELLVTGLKSIEVRSWWPREQLPVLVAIHAGLSGAMEAPAPIWEQARLVPNGVSFLDRSGGIVGVARLVDRLDFGCRVSYTTVERGHEEFVRLAAEHLNPLDWWAPRMVGLRFDRPQRFREIIPLKGRLGLYSLAPEIEARVREAMGAGRAGQ